MAKHQACHGCMDGCTSESAVHCTSCVNEPWPCDARQLLDEIEQKRQKSRDEDTVRIRLNHARIEARDALQELIPFAEEHVRLSYRDADVPQMLADPVLNRARSVVAG